MVGHNIFFWREGGKGNAKYNKINNNSEKFRGASLLPEGTSPLAPFCTDCNLDKLTKLLFIHVAVKQLNVSGPNKSVQRTVVEKSYTTSGGSGGSSGYITSGGYISSGGNRSYVTGKCIYCTWLVRSANKYSYN